jgi:hemolysin III
MGPVQATAMKVPLAQVKPRLRGVSHEYAFFVSVAAGVALILAASDGRARLAASIYAWAGALGGVIFKLLWIDAPKWLFAGVYVALGAVTAAVIGELPAAIGWLGLAGLVGGGVLYTIGAVVYATQRPDPSPKVFGYHEVFHALVLAAASLHYAVIAFAVLPHG